MKITNNQLKKLVLEAIQQKMPGELEPWTIKESSDAKSDPYTAADKLANDWMQATIELYDDGDPVMSANGHEMWHAQCDAAGDDLVSMIMKAVTKVEENLHNGEYADAAIEFLELHR